MELKETKIQISLDAIKNIVNKLKQKGIGSLDIEEIAICVTTIGFADVCKNLGTQWTSKNQKQSIQKIKKSNIQIQWLSKKSLAQNAPLLTHCARGDVGKVKEFIKKLTKQQKQSLLYTVDLSKKSPLHIAAKQGYDVLIQYLITQGFSVNARDRQLKIPLHYSCINGHQIASNILLKHRSVITTKDNKGCNALHYAASSQSPKLVQLIVEQNQKLVVSKDYGGKTPLHLAVMNTSENQIDIIRILLQNGANINQRDEQGKTALHYASQAGKSRCIPILLKKKASLKIKDNNKKTALDLASNERVKKLIQTYSEQKGVILQNEQIQLQKQFESKLDKNPLKLEVKDQHQIQLKQKENINKGIKNSNNPLLGGDINQISTWLREKFFVFMKKLQQSGVKAKFHIKRPYIYTGSWLQEVDSIDQLFSIFNQISGPEVAMRTFNILCPYEKKLPTNTNKAQIFEGFFGQKWFGNQPLQTIKKSKGQDKLRKEVQVKQKQIQELKIELLGYKSELQKLENQFFNQKQQIKQYKKLEQEVRRQRTKNSKQYSEILKLTNQNEEFKKLLQDINNGQDQVTQLNNQIKNLKLKNSDLQLQIQSLKSYEAAARRKCGKLFLKALQNPNQIQLNTTQNLYDDDAIISLYQLLESNPPGLLKRLQTADKNGDGKLTVEQFNSFLEKLKMLPQDVISLNRIVGFVGGKKFLGINQFIEILENRPQIRVQWQKKLIKKLNDIISNSEIQSARRLFQLIDKDGNRVISISEMKLGLQQYNIFINQKDLNNLFNLLDADKSGQVNLEQFQTLLNKQQSEKNKKIKNKIQVNKKQEQDKKNSKPSLKNEKQKQKSESKKQQNDEENFQENPTNIKTQQKQNYQQDQSKENEQQQKINQNSKQLNQSNDQQNNRQQKQQQQNQGQQQNQESQKQKQEQNKQNQQHSQNQQNQQQKNQQEFNQQDNQKAQEERENQENQQNQQNQENREKQQIEQNQKKEQSEEKYSEEKEQEEDNEPRYDGIIKLQIPFCKGLINQQTLQKVALVIFFDEYQLTKIGDFSQKKWAIAVKFAVKQKKLSEVEPLKIILYLTRTFDQENYLGQIQIPFEEMIQKPNQFGINKGFNLKSVTYQKKVQGAIGVQIKWIPGQSAQN